jgi:tetratricopeptide (TPR) repeat protein
MMQVSKYPTLFLMSAIALAGLTTGCNEVPGAVNASTPDDIVDLGLTDPAYYITLGNEFRSNQRTEEAISAYRKAILVDISSLDAYNSLGGIFLEQRRLEEAISVYRRAIQVDPRDARAYIGLGKTFAELKRVEEAIAAYRRAVQVNPEKPEAYEGLATLLTEQNKLDEAVKNYKKALHLPEKSSGKAHAAALIGLGRALQGQQKLEDAIAMFRRAIQVAPNNSWAYVFLGRALIEKKQFEEARSTYQQALKLPNIKRPRVGETHAMAYNGLGMLLQRQGKLKGAIAAYEHAVDLDLSYETAHRNLKGAKRLLANQPQPKHQTQQSST